MKLGTRDDDDPSNSIQNTEKSHQLDLHTDQYNDAKLSSVSDNSSEQTSTNNIPVQSSDHMTLNLGDLRLSQPRSYVSCTVKSPKFGNNSNNVSFNQKLSRSNGVDISCSLPSFPLGQSFGLQTIISSKSTSNFELAKQCH